MTHSFLPELPAGYRWQLIGEDGTEITDDYYAECDAIEARIWTENGDAPELVLTRTGDYGYWGPDGDRKWAIETASEMTPKGLYHWEQFDVLADVGRRVQLPDITQEV